MKFTKQSALAAAVVFQAGVVGGHRRLGAGDARGEPPGGPGGRGDQLRGRGQAARHRRQLLPLHELQGIHGHCGAHGRRRQGDHRSAARQQPSTPSAKEDMAKAVDTALAMARSSGMGEVDGVGMSSVAVDKQLYLNKFFMHHPQGADKGLLWKMFGGAPRELKALRLMPADTVLCASVDYDAELAYRWVADNMRQSGIQDAAGEMDKMEQDLLEKRDRPEKSLRLLRQELLPHGPPPTRRSRPRSRRCSAWSRSPPPAWRWGWKSRTTTSSTCSTPKSPPRPRSTSTAASKASRPCPSP